MDWSGALDYWSGLLDWTGIMSMHVRTLNWLGSREYYNESAHCHNALGQQRPQEGYILDDRHKDPLVFGRFHIPYFCQLPWYS